MTVTFFQDLPVPEEPRPGRTVRYVPPAWAGAPAHELPAVVHVGQFLHRSRNFVLAVELAKVYSTGCSFNLTWTLRRAQEDDEAWAELNGAFFGHPHSMQPIDRRPFAALLLGVQLADGTKARADSTLHARYPPSTGKQPDPPALVLQNHGGNGGDDEMAGKGSLWLWPLPPPGDIRLVAQWAGLGMPETSITIDGGQLREAAAGAQKYWP
ncbi:hypothetical protein [Pseudarthrobacter sp. NamB4]|uniref:hypothetical protein n=1 Tax=Pseudarthrobacter sp. NamB4 TaxID=2576837 RepID=UPI001F0EB881|nr:hypothetical protein [Pseudarthrobacter sp. NamB4]